MHSPQSSSASRLIAGAFGFLTFTLCRRSSSRGLRPGRHLKPTAARNGDWLPYQVILA
jgi:hypothetical protein